MVAENTDQLRVPQHQPHPEHVILIGPIASGWTMHRPLTLLVEQEGDGLFVVSDDVFALYGDGETLSAARQSYIVSLIDYYEMVAEHAGEESFDSEGLARLRTYVQPDH